MLLRLASERSYFVGGCPVADSERFSGSAIGAIAAGGLLVFAGIKGYSMSATLKAIIQGKSPLSQTNANPITGASVSGTSTTSDPVSGTTPNQSGAYSNSQLQSLWVMAGGSQSTAATAACIAEHESSGDATVTSSNPDGGTNVGLWQLDTPGGKGAGYTVAQLQNALTNARVAVAGTSDGTDWSAWATASECGV
jgi:hypothetical protein